MRLWYKSSIWYLRQVHSFSSRQPAQGSKYIDFDHRVYVWKSEKKSLAIERDFHPRYSVWGFAMSENPLVSSFFFFFGALWLCEIRFGDNEILFFASHGDLRWL